MKKKIQSVYAAVLPGTVLLVLALLAWFHQPQEISVSERRKLAQLPEFGITQVLDGSFMQGLESCSQDQFPFREQFRRLKSVGVFYLYRQKDIHGIYVADGSAAAIEESIRTSSVSHALDCFSRVYNQYVKELDASVYACIVPDKGYYLAEKNGYPSMDYDAFFALFEEGMPYAEFISVVSELTGASYYRTDSHWKQEEGIGAADRIRAAMGHEERVERLEEKLACSAFYGVYYGQAALPMEPDQIRYLDSPVISEATVYNYETGQTTGVYDWEKLSGNDPYEFFLSGAAALLEIENPNAAQEKELIVFRDSNASSLVPLLIEDYSRITLIDIRYVNSRMLGQFIDFSDKKSADVLFLYGTTLLNNSSTIH